MMEYFMSFSSLSRYKLAAKKAASIPCGSCKKKPPEDAAKSCLDCKSPYCTECFANHHPWGTPRAQHVCIGPTYNYRPKVRGLPLLFYPLVLIDKTTHNMPLVVVINFRSYKCSKVFLRIRKQPCPTCISRQTSLP